MLVDIGVNLSNPQFVDVEAIINRAMDAGVSKLVLTGTSIEDTRAVINLCHEYDQQFPNMLFATAGIHPHDARDFSKTSMEELKVLASEDHVVAIGETGLDFFRNLSSTNEQVVAFEQQIELAIDCGKPLFMHERDAAKRQLDIIKYYINDLPSTVIHCFTGDKETLYNYLDLDLFIGITGWICDERRGTRLQEIVHNIPLNRLMIETDAPYLLPRNIPKKPKNRVNEPSYLPYILQSVIEHRRETREVISQATFDNAVKFFGLPTH